VKVLSSILADEAKRFLTFSGLLLVLFSISYAAPPPDLPGVEIKSSPSMLPVTEKKAKAEPENPKEDTPLESGRSIEEQLGRDQTLIGMGQGAIFIPVLTEPRLEPEVQVLRNGNNVAKGEPGHRILVEPGLYEVKVGSGTLPQKQAFWVEVFEGKTSVIPFQWGALSIMTVDETGLFVSEDYEVYRLEDGESYGKGYGLPQERLKDIRTWILEPGLYKIVRSGEDFASYLNYITVQVNDGLLAEVELVFNSETGDLVSGGVRPGGLKINDNSAWSFQLRMGGAVTYSNTMERQPETGKIGKEDEIVSMLSDIRFLARYDDTKWLGTGEIYSKNNFQWENDNSGADVPMRSISDDIQLRSTLVRRLNKWVGPYIRGTMKTHLVSEDFWPDDTDSIYVLNTDGDTTEVMYETALQVKPPFFPLEFREGAGVNLELISAFAFEFSSQLGLAWRQTLNNDVLVPYSDSSLVFRPAENFSDYGMETAAQMRIFLGRSISIDLLGEVFFPEAVFSDYRIEEASIDFRWKLFRNFELSYLHELRDAKTEAQNQVYDIRFTSSNSVTLRYFLNF